jgi:hypothetical protein
MAFKSFRVGPSKGLVLAELEEVPNLLVVVGPNGSGKSTLLYELQRNRGTLAEPRTRVIYLNPYRPWRRTTFGTAFLYNLPYSYRQRHRSRRRRLAPCRRCGQEPSGSAVGFR